MSGPTEQQVRDALNNVPEAAKLIDGIAAKDGHIQVALAIDPKAAKQMEPVRKAAETALRAMPGVLSATVVLTAAAAAAPKPAPQAAPAGHAQAVLADWQLYRWRRHAEGYFMVTTARGAS